jgi:purine-binding chemotaxis protein CheW
MLDDPTPAAAEIQLVVFRLGEDYFAMHITNVNEIIRQQKITSVPKAPEFVEGVTNLRGRVIPVIDLRKRFGITPRVDANMDRIIVVEHEGRLMGMMVDSVDEVLTVPFDSIEPADELVVSVDSEFLAGIVRLEERLIILMDQEQVLTSGEVKQLDSMKVTGKALKAVQAQAADEQHEEVGLLA